MRTRISAALLMVTSAAVASPPITPALVPELIGASSADIERQFGKPMRNCSVMDNTVCNYRANDGLRIFYRNGRAVEAVWFPPKGTKAVSIEDLRLGAMCKTKEVDPSTGSDVLRGCPRQLTVDLGNMKSGEIFSLTVRVED